MPANPPPDPIATLLREHHDAERRFAALDHAFAAAAADPTAVGDALDQARDARLSGARA